jgi:hypothetical protein
MSANNRVVPLVIPTTTNRDFLELIFGDRWDQALVTSFKRDPSDPQAPREDWNAWLAGDVLTNPHFDEGNTYFCPSLLVPGSRDRIIENFRSLHVIVIDDVGTKIKLIEVVNLLRVQPTYVIETSPGNHQAGWKIEAETNLAWVKGMLTQLDRTLGGADNLTNPVAWRRLPVGFNTKQKWVDQLGPQGFRLRLRKGYPGPMIRGLDWPSAIEDMIGEIVPLTTLDRGIGDGHRPDAQQLTSDPIYRALEEAGFILGEKITSDKHWAVTIKCPWIAGHGPTRPLTGAEYVPAIPGQRGWFHCFHCERRGQAEFREELDAVLRLEGARIVASFEFDEVDPAAIPPVSYARLVTGQAIDLWDQKTPPAWPGGILPAVLEDTLSELAERDGLDLGASGSAMITAASGAADKRATLTPYAGSQWTVPPVLWLMLIAEPGQRKTAILGYLMGLMRKRNAERMRAYAQAMTSWRAVPAPQRAQQPAPTVRALLAEDTTIEKLQEWMADNPRGLLYLRDELASLFEFGRYTTGTGAAERANFLEFYEGGPTTIGRMTRTTSIDNCALSIMGGIQPHRLADFKGLADDGLLPRFGTLLMQRAGVPLRKNTPPDISAINATIERLLLLGPDAYRTDTAGEDVIRDIEKMGESLAQRPDIGVGYRGFLRKLHGTHARVSLVLHLMDGGQDQVVPVDTVTRAARYTVFLLDHAEIFYAGLEGSAEHTAQSIGSYLLRHPVSRVTAGQLRRDVAACRPLRTLKEIQDAVFLLVIGGWLVPETNYPSNSAWRVRPDLGDQFAARKTSEAFRVEGVKAAMNHRGLYRETQ